MITILGYKFGIDIEIGKNAIYLGISLGATFFAEFYFEQVWPYIDIVDMEHGKDIRWQYGSFGVMW